MAKGIKINWTDEMIQKLKDEFSYRFNKDLAKDLGVSWNKKNKKWISLIHIRGKLKYLGSFDSEVEASNIYQNKLIKLKKTP